MSTTYLSVDYFPLTVNFFDRDAIELAEAKYGIRVDGAVCKLLCKIFKEGYYIPWGEEQSLIFARKLGGELKGKEIDGIIQILLDKGFFDKESYEKFQILSSSSSAFLFSPLLCPEMSAISGEMFSFSSFNSPCTDELFASFVLFSFSCFWVSLTNR